MWDDVQFCGPGFGYLVNASKTWLVFKDHWHSAAISAFAGTNMNITTKDRPHLGSPLRTDEYVSEVESWNRNWFFFFWFFNLNHMQHLPLILMV